MTQIAKDATKKESDKMKDDSNDTFYKNMSGPREIVLCGKVSKPLSDQVRLLVKNGRYGTINDFVEQAILEKMKRETEDGGINYED